MTERTGPSDVTARAALHRALGDETRLRIVDELLLSDRSPTELASRLAIAGNLLAFHLEVLEDVGVIGRTTSQGDARRRYVQLRHASLAALGRPAYPRMDPPRNAVFVCTANSARSQLAAHLWAAVTGRPALSAGTRPGDRVHPLAVAVARDRGLDLSRARPTALDEMTVDPDLIVSVCDRAHERDGPAEVPVLHWSVPDPAGGDRRAFVAAFDTIATRIDLLARATRAA